MNILEMNWKGCKNIDKDVLIVSLAPIEEHGLHLPLGTDIMLTRKWVADSVIKLQEQKLSIPCITFPIIPLGTASEMGFPGCIYINQRMLYFLIKRILGQIVSWGAKHVVVLSGHGDPRHQIAIEQACKKVNRKYGECCFSPMGAIFSQTPTIGYEPELREKLKAYPHDYHAGYIETSLIQYYNHHLVDSCYKELPDTQITDKDMIRPKFVAKSIADYGHIGYPRLSDPKLGAMLHKQMTDEIAYAITCFYKREGHERYKSHQLYKIPFLRVMKLWR